MSEPSSFFAKITIEENRYKEFLEIKPQEPLLDEEWMKWWDSKKKHGKANLTQEKLYTYSGCTTNKAVIDMWVDIPSAFAYLTYDISSQTMNLSIMQLSENYFEMIPMISLMRHIAEYKKEESTDFCIIYPYMWEKNPKSNVYMKYKDGKSFFVEKLQKEDKKVADAFLLKEWNKFASSSDANSGL